jgi:hypothetical protein
MPHLIFGKPGKTLYNFSLNNRSPKLGYFVNLVIFTVTDFSLPFHLLIKRIVSFTRNSVNIPLNKRPSTDF